MAPGTSPLTSSRAAASVCLRSLPPLGICDECACSPFETTEGVSLELAHRLQSVSRLTKALCRAGPPQVLLTYRALLFCYCLGLGISQTLTRGVWVFAYYTMWCALAGGRARRDPPRRPTQQPCACCCCCTRDRAAAGVSACRRGPGVAGQASARPPRLEGARARTGVGGRWSPTLAWRR